MKRDLKTWLGMSILITLITLIVPIAGFAQGSDPTEDDVNKVAKQLYCPVCENIPLDACGTAACEQWRGIIYDKLKEGWTEDQIKDYFVAQYGDRVLAEPPKKGFNWLVYLVPLLVFAGGGFLLYRGFNRWKDSAPAGVTGEEITLKTDPIKDKYINRIEDELKKRSGGSK